jgi:hypothetical protein
MWIKISKRTCSRYQTQLKLKLTLAPVFDNVFCRSFVLGWLIFLLFRQASPAFFKLFDQRFLMVKRRKAVNGTTYNDWIVMFSFAYVGHLHAHIFTYTRARTHIHTRTHTDTRVHWHRHIDTRRRTHTLWLTHTHTHTHTHKTHTHTHTHNLKETKEDKTLTWSRIVCKPNVIPQLASEACCKQSRDESVRLFLILHRLIWLAVF